MYFFQESSELPDRQNANKNTDIFYFSLTKWKSNTKGFLKIGLEDPLIKLCNPKLKETRCNDYLRERRI